MGWLKTSTTVPLASVTGPVAKPVTSWHEPTSPGPGPVGGSDFVPVTVPRAESIVKVSLRLASGAATVPGRGPGCVCGAIVTVPCAVNVPGYGPVATPLAV